MKYRYNKLLDDIGTDSFLLFKICLFYLITILLFFDSIKKEKYSETQVMV